MTELEKCINFLKNNGYIQNNENPDDYTSFEKNQDVSSIDIDEKEIVFINDNGDWLHIRCDYYALIGALIHHNQIGISYKHINTITGE